MVRHAPSFVNDLLPSYHILSAVHIAFMIVNPIYVFFLIVPKSVGLDL